MGLADVLKMILLIFNFSFWVKLAGQAMLGAMAVGGYGVIWRVVLTWTLLASFSLR